MLPRPRAFRYHAAMVDFARGSRELELEARTKAFIRDVVIGYERDPRQTRHGPTDELCAELRAGARAAGLLAPQVGTEWGGYGLDHRETATVLRASGYSLLGPIAMNCMAPDEGNMHLLEKIATPAQKQRFLRPLAAGASRSAFLMTEPDGGAGSDPSMLRTEARKEGSEWVISGRKWLITGARGASFAIIMARTGDRATMFLADMPTPGLAIERVLNTLDEGIPGGHAIMRLDDVRVPEDQILGELHEGFRYAQVRLAPARLTHCMRWWGAAQRAHDVAVDYACTRRGFGKPLIEHEGVGFMLAKNEVELRQTQLMIDHVAWTLDEAAQVADRRGDTSVSQESSMAKFACAELLYGIVDRCVQVLGGLGVTDETAVGPIYREIRAFRLYDGPSEVHLWSLANRIQRRWERSNST